MDQENKKKPSPYQHLKRLGIVFVCFFSLLIVARVLLKPATFGQYGHYRGRAIDEIRGKDPNYVGKAGCLECHLEGEAATDKAAAGKHKRLSCEACHGPMGRPVGEPPLAHDVEQTEENSVVNFKASECLRCHQTLSSRPRFMRQVNPASHFPKESCFSCHDPHNPAPHASTGKLKTADE